MRHPSRCCVYMLIGSCLIASHVRGADIIWFSASDIEADAGFVDLLEDDGHNVMRIAEQNPLTSETIATLNMSDLVITSRAVNSGAFDGATNVTNWNEEVTVPMLAMSGYIIRNNRLGWITGDGLPDLQTESSLVATDPDHPVFDGITFQGDGVTTANPYNVVIDRGISTPNSAPDSGGVIIANTAGIENGWAIAEFPAGMTVTDETSLQTVLAAPRYFFAGGSREADGAGVPTAGMMDLTETGQTLFVNFVDYILTAEQPIPGDFDGDRDVDENDFFILSDNLGAHLDRSVSRADGDLNFDGQVDLEDFGQFKELFPGAFAAAQGVPEPATSALLACVIAPLSLMALRKRRRIVG